MSAESTINGYLSGYAPLVADVGTRIYPEVIAQDAPLPVVVYNKLEGEVFNDLEGNHMIGRYRFSVQAWHRTKDSAEAVLDKCIAALAANKIPIETRTATFDEEIGLHGAVLEFDYWG